MTEPVHPSRGGGRAGVVLLALLFLGVLGGALGYVFGHEARQAAQADSDVPGAILSAGQDSAAPSSTHCPSASEQTAGRALIQVSYLQTNRSQVWICRDADGNLYYQGLTATNGVFTDNNSILVPDVQDEGGDKYVATNHAPNGIWKYTVSKSGLVVQQLGKPPTTEPAVTGG